MTSDPVWKWSAVETAERVAARDVSAREVVDAHLARLAAVNGEVNAVTVEAADQARRVAAVADDATAAGLASGPLHGVPVTIKENVDVAGQATPNGLPALAGLVAEHDSPLVGHLRRAGAMIIGRTNTPEMSLRWHTDNPLRGATLNPWDAGATPGGSSGGAAASLVLGIGALAHGNDLGGSLRYPSHCCGLSTIRPTIGRVPSWSSTAAAERGMAFQLMAVQGPIGRTVADVRLVLGVMAARDAHDPWHVPVPVELPRPAAPPAVAVTYGPPGQPAEPAVRAAVDAAAAALDAAGYRVAPAEPPAVEECALDWRAVIAAETRLTMPAVADMLSEEMNRSWGWMLDGARELDLAGYVELLATRNARLREWNLFLDEHPLVLAPVSQRPAFAVGADVEDAAGYDDIVATQAMLVAVNYLALPAAAVPAAMAGDVPVGVQIIGQRFREDLCLDAAQVVETAVGVFAERLWERRGE